MTCGCNDKCELPKALQINNPGEVTLFHRVDIPASQGDDTTYPPKNGLYRNVLLVYLANNHSYLYNSDGIPTRVDGPAGPGTAAGGETGQVLAKRSDADYDTTWVTQTSANDATLTISRNDTPVGTFTANASVDKTIDIEVPTKTSDLTNDGATGESTYAEATDIADIWEEIEEIEAASDVTDVVGTYAELEAYDTSKLKDNDIIKVLEDETQDDQITYYRWDTDTETFTLIGAIGPYYTKSEADTTFQGKLTAGSNITIDANNEISATDTTYSDFTGATSSVAGSHGLVPAPTTSDPDKFLKGDGTWGTPPGATYTGGTGIDITGNVVSVDNTVAMQSDLPTKTSDLINDGSDNTSTYVEADELATVATSGSYNDLLNKPTIPTVNDATLTIQKNGTTVQTFTANSSTNKTANITVPTKTSDLTNDGSDNTSTYVEADELQPSYIEGEGTSITFTSTQGAQFKDIELKGDTKQTTYSGKNLFNVFATPVGSNLSEANITATVNSDGTISTSGTSTAAYKNIRFDMTLPAGTYKFSGCPSGGTQNGYSVLLVASGNSYWDYGSGATFTLSATTTINVYPVRLGSDTGINMNGKIFKPMVTVSTASQTFEPYVGGAASPNPSYPQAVQTVTGEQTITINDGDQQSQTYKINLGKNLFDKSNAAQVLDGYFINAGAQTIGQGSGYAVVYIKCQPNTTYTVSKTLTSRFTIASTSVVPANGVSTSVPVETPSSATSTFTTNSSARYLAVMIRSGSDTLTTQQIINTIQIEVGSTATSYASYFTPIELCKIGNYQDYIYKDNDTWYLHKETGHTNIGLFTNRTSAASNYRFVASLPSNIVHPLDTTSGGAGYCNMANLGTAGATWDKVNTWTASATEILFNLDAIAAMSLADANTWLASNSLPIYYPLATATDTPITGTLLDDLNALASATGYRGTTVITATAPSPDLPAILSLSTALPSALPLATTTSVGMVSVGDGLEADANGRLSIKNVDNLVYSEDPGTPIGDVVDPYTYSTSSDVRIGSWNGKPLYRHITQFTTPSSQYTYTQVDTGLPATTDFAFIENGFVVNGSEGWTMPINGIRCDSDSTVMGFMTLWVRLQGKSSGYNKFAVSAASSVKNLPATVMILYTKSTD